MGDLTNRMNDKMDYDLALHAGYGGDDEAAADKECVLQLSTPGGVTHKLLVPHVTAAAIIRMHAGMCEPGAPHRFIMRGCYSIDLAAYSLVAATPLT